MQKYLRMVFHTDELQEHRMFCFFFQVSFYINQNQMIRNFLFRFSLLMVGIILLQACSSHDEVELKGKIVGTVYEEFTGKSLRDCEVTVSPYNRSVKTAADGTFTVEGLEAGSYTLRFNKPGYEEKTLQQTVIYGLNKPLEVSLKVQEMFALSEKSLDFGDLETKKSFYLINNGAEQCTFKMTHVPQWASISESSGSLQPSSSKLMTVVVDRDKVARGSYEEELSMVLEGQETVTLSLSLSLQKMEKAAPTVTIAKEPVTVDLHSITIQGNLIATGGSLVTRHGHCWSTDEQPTIEQSSCDWGTREAVGEFVSVLKDLAPHTTYYIRSYAVNAQGIAYSDQVKVTTADEISDRWDGSTAEAFSGGSGVMGDPYLITTGAQLNLIRAPRYCGAQFKLMNAINLDHRPWQPIENFSGELDGGNFTISNLEVQEKAYDMGLFGQLTGTVRHLHLNGVKIISPERMNLGALAGSIGMEALLEDCSVTLTEDSKIQGKQHVGGLVGKQNDRSSIRNCQVIGTTSAPQIVGAQEVGGLVGSGDSRNHEPLTISNCQVDCTISGNAYIGGVMGSLRNPNINFQIENSSFTGQLECQEYGGGIIGSAYYGLIAVAGCKVDAILRGKNIGGMVSLRENGDCTLEVYGSYFKGLLKGTGHSGLLVAQFPSAFIYTSASCYGCYTAPVEGSTYEYVLSGGRHEDCATTGVHTGESVLGVNSVDECRDIVRHLKGIRPEFQVYWDFDHRWVSEAVIEGQKVKVDCPKLIWE